MSENVRYLEQALMVERPKERREMFEYEEMYSCDECK